MKLAVLAALIGLGPIAVHATTLNMVPIYQPLSRHGTDGNEISDIGETLQATVMATPMVLTGAFPETLAEAMNQPHKIPTNNPNYKVEEANLLVLCGVKISAQISEGGAELKVEIDVSKMEIPAGIDLTQRQVLKLAIVALRKTLEEYQKLQTEALTVVIFIAGAEGDKSPLNDLTSKMHLEAQAN